VGNVQLYEDKTNEAIMALESNAEIMKSLQTFYSGIVEDQNFPPSERDVCTRKARDFISRMDEFVYDTKTLIARAKSLAKVASDRKTVVSARHRDFGLQLCWRLC
jgi:hypothetical protein